MKLACLTLLLTLTLASGELLATLRVLHSSDIYQYLTPEEQRTLTEIVAAAESCKLIAWIQEYGRDTVTQMIVHLPQESEAAASKYITDHVNAEQARTCQVE